MILGGSKAERFNLFKEAIGAMYIYAQAYKDSELGPVEFWNTLSEEQKSLVREMILVMEDFPVESECKT